MNKKGESVLGFLSLFLLIVAFCLIQLQFNGAKDAVTEITRQIDDIVVEIKKNKDENNAMNEECKSLAEDCSIIAHGLYLKHKHIYHDGRAYIP